MKKLMTIGESHPEYELNKICRVFLEGSNSYREYLRNLLKNPSNVVNENYWASLCKLAGEEYEKVLKANGIDKDSLLMNFLSKERLLDRINRNAKLILQKQAQELQGKYETLFLEGNPVRVIGAYATSIGKEVVYLDEGFPYEKSQNPRIHWLREQNWINKILKKQDLESSLLIVGEDHSNDMFGFSSNLRKKGIELIII